jgi:hypothetical protein
MCAARQFFDQMPIDATDKEKIAHLNAEACSGSSSAMRDGMSSPLDTTMAVSPVATWSGQG